MIRTTTILSALLLAASGCLAETGDQHAASDNYGIDAGDSCPPEEEPCECDPDDNPMEDVLTQASNDAFDEYLDEMGLSLCAGSAEATVGSDISVFLAPDLARSELTPAAADLWTECKCALAIPILAAAIGAATAAVVAAWPFVTAIAAGAAITGAATAAIGGAVALVAGVIVGAGTFIEQCGGTVAAGTVCAALSPNYLLFEVQHLAMETLWGANCVVAAPPAWCNTIRPLRDKMNEMSNALKNWCGW